MAIKYKAQIVSIMLACIAGAAFIGWQRSMLRSSMVRILSTKAKITADNCKAALMFEDVEDAEKTLKALKADSSIVFGCVYKKNDEVFASYARTEVDKTRLMTTPQKKDYEFSEGLLTVFQPVVLDNETIGTICLQSDLEFIHTTLRRSIQIIIAVLFLTSPFAVFLVLSGLQVVGNFLVSNNSSSKKKSCWSWRIDETELKNQVENYTTLKITKIISYIHLLGCIGWSIFGFVFLIVLTQDKLTKTEAFGAFAFFLAVFATSASGIILFIDGRKKQPENIKTPNVILTTKIIHFLGCIGFSIVGFCSLIFGLSEIASSRDYRLRLGLPAVDYKNLMLPMLGLSALFATTASGIYLSIIRLVNWRQSFAQLWKIKKLIILWTGTFVIVAMCLFPPRVDEGEIMGYAFLFSDYSRAHIDLVRLIIQCAIVGLITGALLYTLKDKKAGGAEK